MLITCKCLNVSMQLGKSKPKGVSPDLLQLSEREKKHPFFSDAVAELEELVAVQKQVGCLVVSQTLDNWVVDSCIGCALPFLARHKNNQKLPLMSSGLILDPNTIQSLKNHPDFSPAFRIVLRLVNADCLAFLGTQSAQIVRTALSELQRQLGDAFQKEGAKTDENIRLYSEQQCQNLTKFRERANTDHESLAKLLFSIEPKSEELSKPAVNSQFAGKPTLPAISTKAIPPAALAHLVRSTPRSKPTGIPGRRSLGIRSHSLFSRGDVAESFDAEGVFDLEGMEDSPPDLGVSEGESDTDHDDSGSHDEGIDLRRKKSDSMTLARSLPVNVPIFAPGGLQLQAVELDDDFIDRQDPQDIAASIKALAQSVHGDAVFGELPRPRFSTQI